MIRSPLTTSPPASPPTPQHTNLTFLWSEENSKDPRLDIFGILCGIRNESGPGLRGGVCGEQGMGGDLNIAHLPIINLFQLIVEVNNIGYDNVVRREQRMGMTQPGKCDHWQSVFVSTCHCSIPLCHYPAAVTRYNLITLPLSLHSINNVIHWL